MFLLVPAHTGSPGQMAVKRLCVCVFFESQKMSKYSKEGLFNRNGMCACFLIS